MCANPDDLAAAVAAAASSWLLPRGSTEVTARSPVETVIAVLGPPYVGGGALAHRIKSIAVPDVCQAARACLRERGYKFTTDPDAARGL